MSRREQQARTVPCIVSDPIRERLEKIIQEHPDLSEMGKIYGAVLPALRDAVITASAPQMTPEEARVKLQKGLPLLHEASLEIDNEELCQLFVKLADVLERHAGDNTVLAAATGRIRLEVEAKRLDIVSLLPDLVAGVPDGIADAAGKLALDPGILTTLLSYALAPFLRQWCRQLAPLVGESPWPRGFCPVCGTPASLAELQGNTQAKHLRCATCGADWTFPRLRCFCCGNEDHQSLGLLFAEGPADRARVEVCDSCQRYLKVISSFDPTPVELLVVEDLATLSLDYSAQGRGYARPLSKNGNINQC